uniref:Uncharacterized protein n=1 Tax=Megaselia scalaris TaxID=36166 RepID=T1GZX4_MEGSC
MEVHNGEYDGYKDLVCEDKNTDFFVVPKERQRPITDCA